MTALVRQYKNSSYRLVVPAEGSIKQLQFQSFSQHQCKANEIAIHIRAVALNLRDVLHAIGMYQGVGGVMGLDCAGVVVDKGDSVQGIEVGDNVFGLSPGCIANYVVDDARRFIKLPETLSFVEAATLPTTFLTAYIALVELANLQEGEKILIHSAAGGVGTCAVQLSNILGAEVFATTSSDRKIEALKKFGVKHFYSSRSTDFAQEILSDTQNAGVDVALNCLTSEGFIESTLKACADKARFIELARVNIWTEKEVKAFQPDLKYYVMTDDVALKPSQEINPIYKKMNHLLQTQQLKPLPFDTFDVSRIRRAFRFMQQAKHIGKVVIDFPEDPMSINEINKLISQKKK